MAAASKSCGNARAAAAQTSERRGEAVGLLRDKLAGCKRVEITCAACARAQQAIRVSTLIDLVVFVDLHICRFESFFALFVGFFVVVVVGNVRMNDDRRYREAAC